MITFNDIAILIPAYNEEKTIRHIVEGCLTYCPHILVIDDGSNDETIEKIKDLPIVIIHNDFNIGKDQSLIRGFSVIQRMNPKAIITIDADGQHNPDDLPRFIMGIKAKPDHVILGARVIDRKNAPRYRRFGNRMADFFISWAAGQKIVDTQSGFRLLPNSFIQRYIKHAPRDGHFVLESEILITAHRMGFEVVAIPIATTYEEDARASHYKPMKDSLAIASMVFVKLLFQLFNPIGLIKALFQKKPIINP